MRRDVCYFFETDVITLYNAYLSAAKNEQFRRECSEEPYHTFSFGINFSMKYNMNGGACTLHFMPYQNGSAVNLRFSVAQLAGARYGKYAEDLTQAVANILSKAAYNVNIDVEEFLKEENKVVELQPLAAEAVEPQPVVEQSIRENVVQEETFVPKFCTNCGNALAQGVNFCSNCGAKIKVNLS